MNRYLINVAMALAVSLLVNLSYFMVLVINASSSSSSSQPAYVVARDIDAEHRMRGVIHIAEDGSYGNVVNGRDSVYVERSRIRQYGLQDGDTIRFAASHSRRYNMANPSLYSVSRVNGELVAPPIVKDARNPVVLSQQIFFYFLLSLMIIFITTERGGRVKIPVGARMLRFIIVLLLSLVALYLLAPEATPRRGSGLLVEVLGRYPFDFMLLLRWSFALVVSLLYSYLWLSINQQQRINIENERLKIENITTQYNVLMNQVNPHFLFNSLNSLSMLVREGDKERSLTYIDQLSYTFRYTLQSGELKLTTLSEEMRFVDAYIYLFKIRYAEKLTFDIDITDEYKSWLIPPLSLQPLLDNAVKHNVITSAKPLTVRVGVKNGVLVVSNPIRAKIEREPSTGIGIENLRNRWLLLTSRPIEVSDSDGEFIVKLPLIKGDNEDCNS